MSVIQRPSAPSFALDEDTDTDGSSLGPGSETGSFAGRLSRAISRSPLPLLAAGVAAGTKGVPQVDVVGLEAVSLQQTAVPCVPRFWEAAELLSRRVAVTPEEDSTEVAITKDATSKQSSDERKDRQNLYSSPNPGASTTTISSSNSSEPQSGSQAMMGRTAAPASVASPKLQASGGPHVASGLGGRPKSAPDSAAGTPSQGSASSSSPSAQHGVDAKPGIAHNSSKSRSLVAKPTTAAPRAPEAFLRAAEASSRLARLSRRADVDALTPPRSSTPAQASNHAPSPAEAGAPRSANAHLTTSKELAPGSERGLPASAHELPLSQVQWKEGEARVSVQTDAGALALHVRVKSGVADVAASGPAAKQLEGKAKELQLHLANDGLALGRFAAADLHHTAAAMAGLNEQEGDSTPCQEPDEEDGTASADGDDGRRLSGERRRSRPSRRVHVKA